MHICLMHRRTHIYYICLNVIQSWLQSSTSSLDFFLYIYYNIRLVYTFVYIYIYTLPFSLSLVIHLEFYPFIFTVIIINNKITKY